MDSEISLGVMCWNDVWGRLLIIHTTMLELCGRAMGLEAADQVSDWIYMYTFDMVLRNYDGLHLVLQLPRGNELRGRAREGNRKLQVRGPLSVRTSSIAHQVKLEGTAWFSAKALERE